MKSLTIYCNSEDGSTVVIEPGDKDDKPVITSTGSGVILDLPRVRELKKFFTRLEAEVAKRPKPEPEPKPKKWAYGEEA